ncbi:MAG: hypothetical protein ACI8S6_001172 [Myxococcota bacterium]|jgi:hypothetical protein
MSVLSSPSELTLPPESVLTPEPMLPPVATPSPPMTLLDRVLRDHRGLTQAILADEGTATLIPGLVMITACGAAMFGMALGLQGGLAQALSSGIKFPLVMLGAAGITLPILHVGCAMAGLRLRTEQLSALLLQALSVAAVTMAGLAPLMVVAWLTISIGNNSDWFVYRRLVLAAVGVASIGGLVGAHRILRVIPLRVAVPWAGCFGLAGLQLSWLLRPLVSMPEGDFVLLRALESNGLAEVLQALVAVLT